MFSKVKEKKNQFALSSLYKAFNLVVMEVLMLEFPHKMWWFIEMSRMELRTTVFDAGQHPLCCAPLVVDSDGLRAGQSRSCRGCEELWSPSDVAAAPGACCWRDLSALSGLCDPETHRQPCRECFPDEACLCIGVGVYPSILFFLIYLFKLEDNCFTVLCLFWGCNKVNQP